MKPESMPAEVKTKVAEGTAQVQKPTHRLTYVEGMRAIAALYVVLTHVAAFVDPSHLEGIRDRSPDWMQIVFTPFWQGHLAVAAFIVISGFCLRWSANARQAGDSERFWPFLLRRVKRILPPYYASLILSMGVVLTVTVLPGKMPYTQYIPVTVPDFVAHLFLVHNWNPAWMYKINGVLWSIAIEFQIYFFFPALGRVLGGPKVMHRWLRNFAALAACAVATWLVVGYVPRGMKLYPWFLVLFCGGMIAADLALTFPKKLAWTLVFPALAGVAFMVATNHNLNLIYSDCGIAVFVGAVLIGGGPSVGSGWAKRGFEWKPFALVGAFSYSLYLVHHPILQVVDYLGRSTWSHPARHLGLLLVVGVPIAIAVSFGFAWLFESKYLRRALRDIKS